MAIVQLEGGPFDGESALVEATPAEVLEMSPIRLSRLGCSQSAIYRPVQLRPEGDEREYDVLMAHVGPVPFSEGGYVDYVHRREIRVRERSASQKLARSFEDLLIVARLLPSRIVCAVDLREEQIAEAQQCGRYWVGPDGVGWVALPWSITTEKDRFREGRYLLKLVENMERGNGHAE